MRGVGDEAHRGSDGRHRWAVDRLRQRAGLAHLCAGGGAGADGRERRAENLPSGPEIIPDRFIVVVEEGFDPADVAASHGAAAAQVYRHALNGFSGALAPAQVDALRADLRIDNVVPDRVVRAAQVPPTGVNRVDADVAILEGSTDCNQPATLRLAVLDTGIDLSHPELNIDAANAISPAGGGGPNDQRSSCICSPFPVVGTSQPIEMGVADHAIAKSANDRVSSWLRPACARFLRDSRSTAAVRESRWRPDQRRLSTQRWQGLIVDLRANESLGDLDASACGIVGACSRIRERRSTV